MKLRDNLILSVFLLGMTALMAATIPADSPKAFIVFMFTGSFCWQALRTIADWIAALEDTQ